MAIRVSRPPMSQTLRGGPSALIAVRVVLPRVLRGQRLGDALQRPPLGLDPEERLDEPGTDHEHGADEVADRDAGDVLVRRGLVDEPAEEQRAADAAGGGADRVEERDA